MPETHAQYRNIDAARKDLPSVGEEVLDLDELDLDEVGGQAGRQVGVLLPRVIDIRRLVVIYGRIPRDGAGGKLQE